MDILHVYAMLFVVFGIVIKYIYIGCSCKLQYECLYEGF